MKLSRLRKSTGRSSLMAVLFSLLLVFAVACGDDNGGGNNGGTNNGGADAGNNGGTDGGNNGGTDAGNNGGTDTGDDTGDTGGGNDGGTCEPLSQDIGPCDPLCQTGCADSEACVAGRAAEGDPLQSQCLPAGTGVQGDTCGQDSGCEAGFGCFTIEGASQCLEICRPSDATSCGEGFSCAAQDENLDYGVCIPTPAECEQFPPEDTCGEGQNCYQTTGGGFVCADFNDAAAAGDSCGTPTDCNDLQLCVGPSAAEATCMDACDPNAETSRCAETETCTALQGNPDVGVCVAGQ